MNLNNLTAADQHGLPPIVKSAFHFLNGKRIVIFTSEDRVKSFLCDDNWKPNDKPFAECNLSESIHCTPLEYHLHTRNNLHPDSFIQEQSTDLKPYIKAI